MADKKIDSVRPRITSSSSHLASVYGNDFVELVWQNGPILVQGGSQSGTRKRPSCISYSINPSRKAFDEDPSITKRARLNTFYSMLDSSHQNSQPTNDQCSYPFDLKYPKSSGLSNKLGEEFSNLRAQKESNFKPTEGITQLSSSSSQSQKHDLGSDQRAGKLNFSNFLRPALFFKSTYQGKSATQHTRVEEFKAAVGGGSKAPDHSVVIDSAKGSHSLNGIHHDQTDLPSNKAKPTPFVVKCDRVALPDDEHSEAVGHDSALKTQGSNGQYHSQTHRSKRVSSSSLCSLGASNDPTFHSRKHEDTDDSTYVSDNEETEDVIKETPIREGSRGKGSRNAEIHNLSERKRRDTINKKMRALKQLIPNCNKMDKASMLDDAIDYLKTLKLQLQVMSMGSGFCMPLMMLPGSGGGHQLQLPHQLMSMRPGIGIPCSLPPQFSNINIPQLLPSHPQPQPHPISPNTLQMLGFPNQMLPIQFPVSYPPFMSMPPKPIQPNLSAHLTTLDDPDLNAQLASTMQATNQGTK